LVACIYPGILNFDPSLLLLFVLWFVHQEIIPNYAIGEFAQDARRTGSRRTWVLQAPNAQQIG